jgi:hypothetical protein
MFTNEIDRARFQEKYAEAVREGNFPKIAAQMSPYIKVRIYENSICTAILKPRTVQPSDLIPEEGHNDTFFVYGQVEQPTIQAVPLNFRGQGETFVPGGRRFKIPLGRHMSKVSKKPQDELLAFDYDLFAELNDKDIFELHTLRDKKFLWASQAAVITSGKWSENVLSGSATVVRPDKIHFTTNAQLLESGSRTGYPSDDTLKATKHVMGSQIWHDLNLWESEGAGGELVSNITINGYPATMIMGLTYITSIKNVLFVEKDPVAEITYTDVGVNGKFVTIDGIAYADVTSASGVPGDREFDVGGDAAISATNLYNVLVRDQGYVDCLDASYVFSNPSAGVVRVRRMYDSTWNRFSPAVMTLVEDETDATWGTQGYDLFDHIYTFPDADFLGEIVQIAGQEIESDMWKERGEKLTEVCRRSAEFSGGAIGNINGISMTRLQRYKHS